MAPVVILLQLKLPSNKIHNSKRVKEKICFFQESMQSYGKPTGAKVLYFSDFATSEVLNLFNILHLQKEECTVI